MRKNLSLLVLVLLSIATLGISYPKYPEVPNPPGAQWVWDTASSCWRPMAGTSTGNSVSGATLASSPLYVIPVGPNSATATFDIILPAVAYATRSAVILATNSVTLLKNIASFTNGDILYFQGRSKFYWSQSSNPTATATTMQSLANSAEAGDLVGPFRLKTTCDFGFVADSTGICSLTYTLAREQ